MTAPPLPRVDSPPHSSADSGGGRPDIAVWVALATLGAHLLTHRGYGYFRDELYYLACGRHLAWGYVDHPPMIAVLASLARGILGESTLALRLLPALAHAGLVLVSARIARELGGGRAAAALAAIVVAVAPVFLGSAAILNMNPFDQLLWAGCTLLLVRILRGGAARGWIGFGVLAGLGLLTKHSTAFFLVATFAGLLLTPERRLLRTRGPWIAAVIAAAMLAPNLVWQMQHGWPTLEFLRNASAEKNYAASPGEFLAAQALLIHPVAMPLALAGLGALLFARSLARFRALGLAFVLLVAFFMLTHAKHYYLAPAWPPVLAAGAVVTARFCEARGWRAVAPAYAALLLVTGGALAPFTMAVLPAERFVSYARGLGISEPPSERHRPAKLPQTFADMFGWEEMTAAVAAVWKSLPPAERAHCAIFASNYGEAGALDFFGRKHGLPRAHSGHNSYWWWGPPAASDSIVITVGESVADVHEAFADVRIAGVFRHEWNMPYESDVLILIGRRPKLAWARIWPATRKYI